MNVAQKLDFSVIEAPTVLDHLLSPDLIHAFIRASPGRRPAALWRNSEVLCPSAGQHFLLNVWRKWFGSLQSGNIWQVTSHSLLFWLLKRHHSHWTQCAMRKTWQNTQSAVSEKKKKKTFFENKQFIVWKSASLYFFICSKNKLFKAATWWNLQVNFIFIFNSNLQ